MGLVETFKVTTSLASEQADKKQMIYLQSDNSACRTKTNPVILQKEMHKNQ